jgi:hypothetical protein
MPDRALGSMMDHRCTAKSAAQSKAGEKHLGPCDPHLMRALDAILPELLKLHA